VSIRFVLLTVAPAAAGVALGHLLGGRLAGFGTIRIRALRLVWLAAGVQFAQLSADGVRRSVEQTVGVPMLAVIFTLVLIWLAVNIPRWPGTIRAAGCLIVLGAALNGLAIALNGRMPYEPAAARSAGLPAGIVTPKNEPVDAGTRLAALGDTIPLEPFRAVISVGDILIAAGICALVALVMRGHRRNGPAPEPTIAEEVNHDPHLEPATHHHGDLHAGGTGDPALRGRRTADRGQLTVGTEPSHPTGGNR
jgi:hypothetical protein